MHKLTRRHFMGVCALAFAPTLDALGNDFSKRLVEDDTFPELPADLSQYKDLPSLNDQLTSYTPQGTQSPTSDEEKKARFLLDTEFPNALPVEIGLYFLDIKDGKLGDEYRPYVTAWPVRWNPVIVEFFRATDTRPAGDTTAWCAAFVNYCILRSRQYRTVPMGAHGPNGSAASRTFRSWGMETNTPKPGDIVVFKDKTDDAHGHVGFFLQQANDKILVLGGNQFEGSPIRHAISSKWIAKNGKKLELHSFRTDPVL